MSRSDYDAQSEQIKNVVDFETFESLLKLGWIGIGDTREVYITDKDQEWISSCFIKDEKRQDE